MGKLQVKIVPPYDRKFSELKAGEVFSRASSNSSERFLKVRDDPHAESKNRNAVVLPACYLTFVEEDEPVRVLTATLTIEQGCTEHDW